MSIPVHLRIAPHFYRTLAFTPQIAAAQDVRAAAADVVAAGVPFANCLRRKAADVAQRSIEILIGRLITDEAFRSAFRANAIVTLTGFVESGYELTALEIAAVRVTPVEVWEQVAEQIDPRLQKVSYTPGCLG